MVKMRKPLILLVLSVLSIPLPGLISGCDLAEIDELPWEQSPEFEVDSFELSASAIMVGESAMATAMISNVGDEAGIYNAILYMEGDEVDRKDVRIEPENSTEVVFRLRGKNAGSYRLSVEKRSAVITVYDWDRSDIKYDSGTSLGTYFTVGDLGHIVHFTPETKPFKINKILIYGTAALDDPRELDVRQFTLRVWNYDKSRLLWTQDFPWRLFEGQAQWREIDIPDINVDNDFHVELVTNSGQASAAEPDEIPSISIGWDKAAPLDGSQAKSSEKRSGWSRMGVISAAPGTVTTDLNWFIRIEGESTPRVLQYDDGIDEMWHWTTASHFINFSPPAFPYEVQKISIYGYLNVSGEYEYGAKSFKVRIADLATTDVLWEQNFKWDLFGPDEARWVTINVPNIVCEDDFYIRLITNSTDEDDCILIGVDCSNPNRHSYVSKEVLLAAGESRKEKGADYDSENSNWMIRVTGIYR